MAIQFLQKLGKLKYALAKTASRKEAKNLRALAASREMYFKEKEAVLLLLRWLSEQD
ncbi:hypothetical protein GCM10027164_19670 [Algoriphagus taiwanensis]|uniref:Transposase n=1 Tax=Algoriphagus taiwanensis TaxID=1445656 RepID=A0ABQ6PWX3_9BACT|nr:hypothetical protein Ataiwa_07160 [Algoriphagus taiwanensis]